MSNDLSLRLVITADGRAAVTELNGVAAAEQQVGAQGQAAGGGTEALSQSLVKLVGAAVAVDSLTSAIGTLGRTLMEIQGQEQALAAITGSAQAAEAQMDRLKAQAERLGVDLQTLTAHWVSLSAATKGTAMEGGRTAEVFDAVVAASARLGLSSDKLGNAMLAVSQMASKGTISLEDLKGQLAEALPGAMQAMASGMGVTLPALLARIESGSLDATAGMAALAQGLRTLSGTDATTRVETLSAAYARLGNALRQVQEDLGDSGATTTLTWLADMATGLVQAGGAAGVLNAATVALGATLALGAGKLGQWVSAQAQARAADAERAAALQLANAEAVTAAERTQALTAAQVRAAASARAEAAAFGELAAATAVAAQEGQLAARAALAQAEAQQRAALVEQELAAAELRVVESRRLAAVQSGQTAVFEAELTTARLASEKAALNVALVEGGLVTARERLALADTVATEAQQRLSAATVAGEAATTAQIASIQAATGATAALTAAQERQALMAPKATQWTAALTSAMGALSAAMTVVIAADVGVWLDGIFEKSKKAAAAGDDVTESWLKQIPIVSGLKAIWDGLDSTLQAVSQTYRDQLAAEEHLAATQEKTAKTLKQIAEQSGVTVTSVAELNTAVKEGRIYQDALTGAWQAGAGAASNLSAATLTILTQYERLQTLAADQRQATMDLAAAREALAVTTARTLGNEAQALALVAAGDQAAIARAREKSSLAVIALGNAQAELAAAKQVATTKQTELDQLAALVSQRQIAADQAQQGIAVAEQAARASQLQAQTYGDQAALLPALVAQRQTLLAQEQQLTAALTAGQAVSGDLQRVQAALADVHVRLADAATDAAQAQETLVAAQQRQASLASARAGVEQAELTRLRDLATAHGDLSRAQDLSIRLAQSEIAQAQAAADAQRTQAAALSEKARLLEVAAQATGGYTTEEQAQVAVARDAATMAGIEAQKLDIATQAKRDALAAAQALAERQRVLSQAFSEAGVSGVTSMAEVNAAISQAVTSGQIEALGTALRQAFEQGAIAADAFAQSMDALEAKATEVETKGAASAQAMAVTFQASAAAMGEQVAALGDYATEAATIFDRLANESIASFNAAVASGGDLSHWNESLATTAIRAAETAREVDRLTGVLQSGAYAAGDLGQAIDLAQSGVKGLDDERLEGLRSAIASAEAEMEDFADSARDGLRSLQEEWADLNDDQVEVENIQYEERRLDIVQQIAEAEAQGNGEALESLGQQAALAEQIYQKKVAAARVKVQEAQQQAAQTALQPAATSTVQTSTARTVHINLNLGSETVGLDVAAGQEDDLIAALRRAQLVT